MPSPQSFVGPLIVDYEYDPDAESFKAVLDIQYQALKDALVKRDEFMHRFGHQGYMDAKLNGPFGIVDVLLAPSDRPDANPDYEFEDFVSSENETVDPEPPRYTSITILDRDVHFSESGTEDAQSACLVFLTDVARKLKR